MGALRDAIVGAVTGVVAPVAGVFTKKIERQQAKDAINGQVQLAKLQNQAQVNIQTSDWEAISKTNEQGTWKDEYITLSVFTIFNAVILGSVLEAFGIEGGSQMVSGVLTGVQTLDGMNGTVGDLIKVVAYAALSIKFVKDVVR